MAHQILIVDSQREQIRSLQKALEDLRQPMIITGVMSGEEGLLEARLNPVDLLVTESWLPGMSGAELVRAIRHVRPNIKTIFLNGRTPKTTIEVAVDVTFAKPVPIDAFLEAVRNALDLPEETTAPPPAKAETPQEDESHTDHSTNVSDRIATLRQALNADTVTLVNENGEVMIRAGGLQDSDFESIVLPSLMAAFSAGQNVSHFLGRAQQRNIYFYHGEKYDLVMCSISDTYALVVAKRGLISSMDSNTLHTYIKAVQRDITTALEKLGVILPAQHKDSVPPFLTEVEDEPEAEVVKMDDTLESLLVQQQQEKTVNADTFWAASENEIGSGTISSDSLSFDQALQMGLIEEENEPEQG